MNFIAVDLKVIEVHAPTIARASGRAVAEIVGGLALLWHRCWSTKADTVSRIGLAGVFGPDGLEVVVEACVDEGLLEVAEGGWRIKGADHYKRLSEARSKGGKAASKNLIPGARQKAASSRLQPRASREPAEKQPRDTPELFLGSDSALSPNTEHRTPLKALAPDKPAPVPKESDALVSDFREVTGSGYLWQGAKDGVALAELRKTFTLEEVRARWRRGLAAPADEWASCRTVAQLRTKWNDLADAKPQPRVSIEHQPSRIL